MQIMAINSYNVNVINVNVGINGNNVMNVNPISYAISLDSRGIAIKYEDDKLVLTIVLVENLHVH